VIIELKRDYKKHPYNGRLRLDWEIYALLLIWVYTSGEKRFNFYLNIWIKKGIPFFILEVGALGFLFSFIFGID